MNNPKRTFKIVTEIPFPAGIGQPTGWYVIEVQGDRLVAVHGADWGCKKDAHSALKMIREAARKQ
jgi:hypothetical protein